jgi:hypothetical protein
MNLMFSLFYGHGLWPIQLVFFILIAIFGYQWLKGQKSGTFYTGPGETDARTPSDVNLPFYKNKFFWGVVVVIVIMIIVGMIIGSDYKGV